MLWLRACQNLGMSVWSYSGHATQVINTACRHMTRKRECWQSPLPARREKADVFPECPAILHLTYIPFARICLLAAKETEEKSFVRLHTSFPRQNAGICYVGRDRQAGDCKM